MKNDIAGKTNKGFLAFSARMVSSATGYSGDKIVAYVWWSYRLYYLMPWINVKVT